MATQRAADGKARKFDKQERGTLSSVLFWSRTSLLSFTQQRILFAVKMKWYSIAATLVAPSQAALRFGCSTLSIQRLDPLVEPGHIPSAHVHQVCLSYRKFSLVQTNSHEDRGRQCFQCNNDWRYR
jgi:hypothetical protein